MWIKDDRAESRRDRKVAAVYNLSAQTCANLLMVSLAVSTVIALLTGIYH